jgi:Zn-dependent peptidase ImmA (M78 family)
MPAVAINNNDMPAGRVFTLLHEVAHVVRKSGAVLCASVDDETDVEVFCNHVAGAVLVPRGDLLNEPRVRSATSTEQWTDDALAALSRTYSVSREVLLRRLLILGKTSQTFYAAKRARFAAEYASWNQKRKDGTGGPDYLTTVLSQNGRLYARLVLEAYGHHAITASDVSTYLGVRTQHIPELETGVFMRTG